MAVLVRRVLACLCFAVLVPYVFGRLDDAYVTPARLKRLVSLFGVETDMGRNRWRVRFGMAHRGLETYEVQVTAFWLDDRRREVGRNAQQVTLMPGDTTFLSLTYRKDAASRQAVACSLGYAVNPVRQP
jgi:hypothetical protein